MGQIPPDEDGPTYRRTTIRRPRSEARPDASASPDPVAPPPAADEAELAPPSPHAVRAPLPVAPPASKPAAPRPAPAPAPQAAPATPRATMDVDALAAELADMDQGEFARLMASGSALDLQPGDEVEGPIVRLTSDTVFVDIGGKSEAWLPRGEVQGLELVLGQPFKALVLSAGAHGVRLTRSLGGAAARDALENAMEAGVPVEGRVEARNSGGFTISMGGLRAFCPVSHIDRHPEADLDVYLGRSLQFRILELRGKDVVVSHRAIADQQAEIEALAIWDRVRPGDALDGIVTGLKPYGLFVDLGGVTGLVHKSEMGWDSSAEPPPSGTRVKVRVLEVDREQKRLSLSLKDEAMGPWSRLGTEFQTGEVYPGLVRRLAPFGAFVELAPGLEGMVHVSNLADRRVEHPGEVLKVGDRVSVRILSADKERERLELGLKQAVEGWEGSADDDRQRARGGTSHADAGGLGTMADLLKGIQLKKR